MNNRSVYIVYSDPLYDAMFRNAGWDVTNNIYDASLVQFTGGADVHPSLYGMKMHRTMHCNIKRDEKEQDIFNLARELALPMTGICRGGQFLNVMNNGKMWQDVDGHAGSHKAHVNGFIGEITVSSTHHQMMQPSDFEDHIILMTANRSTKKEQMGVDGRYIVTRHIHENNKEDDIEAVYYPNTNCLCYQPHPEYKDDDCRKVYFYFINNYLMQDKTIEELNLERVNNTMVIE